MVVNVDSSRFIRDWPAGGARSPRRSAQRQRQERAGQCVTIGLLNNMAGAAFKATERQFVSLLDSASEGVPIHVSFYVLPGMSPAETGGRHFASHYASVGALLNTQLDGLIVTGREPRMASLRDEPYWEDFTRVLEWARTNTHSAIWSCLAAHAAILHLDGIDRRKSKEKNFGVFDCARVSDHPLTQGLSPCFRVPHSRWNGVAEEDLVANGYGILSRIADDGIDIFMKQAESLFVFFQGHLEYESDTLLREYRRDVQRFVKGETNAYPPLPLGYFDSETEVTLTAAREEAISCRIAESPRNIVAATEEANIRNTWQSSASRIYRNWLECICARKRESHGNHIADVEAPTIEVR
ncbi:MAG: homoserine O-succinyltransferase [Terracidiphilus sp.]|jgi:homoserine O-succinyltransferase